MSKTATRKKYPNDFRIKVAKAAEASSVGAAVKKFKVSEPNVYNWRATLRKHGEAGFVGAGKRGPEVQTETGSTSTHLKQQIGRAISDAVGGAVTSLRAQVAAESKRRIAAERALQTIQVQLQRLLNVTQEVSGNVNQAKG